MRDRWKVIDMTASRTGLNRWCWVCAVVSVLVTTPTAWARVRLENICTVQGQREVRLTGMGLVVGLPGTGDGAKNLPTVRALRAALTKMHNPVLEVDLRNVDSVAVVMLDAVIPRTGLRRGQKVDCQVSAMMGAKSLRGGRLLSAPLTFSEVHQTQVVGLAGGAILVEDLARPTTGKIVQGLDLIQDVSQLYLQQQGQADTVTLLIAPEHASFWTASEVARLINSEFTFETSGRQVARSISPAAVEIMIPSQYRETPVDFIAQLLEVGIDVPTTQARVIVNPRTGTVVVTGEVELSPVLITHKSFTIEIGADLNEPESTTGPFVRMMEGQGRQSPQQLTALVDALNQLRVPADDIIAIIRELHATGKLHAELVER
jgi:flagellar P-ring protein FlgI